MDSSSSSDWTSFASSVRSSPPYTTRRLPLKVRGKMPRRSKPPFPGESHPPAFEVSTEAMAVIVGLASSMSEKSVKKMVHYMSLPPDYEYIVPGPYDRANNPPPGCLSVYASQILSGLQLSQEDKEKNNQLDFCI
ncbi:UNVERIFIED_CONTAM: hypothetical protein Slati_4138400 [Sesamum latifolium]|uniref:Uncharacterized protein n=1 Tax=Sesamum latifolium TaxID=2727402 RepID=A0AAW2T9Q5_9LAMI